MNNPSEILELRDTVEGLRAELTEARRRRDQAEATLSSVHSAHAKVEAELADALARLVRTEAELMRLARFEADFQMTKAEISVIHASQTWKIGRLVMSPIRLIRRFRGR